MLQERQEDIDEAFETFREIGKSLVSTGKQTRDVPEKEPEQVTKVVAPSSEEIANLVVDILNSQKDPEKEPKRITEEAPPAHQPSPEEIATLAAAILNSQSETPEEDVGEAPAERDEEPGKGYPWWLPWAVVGGVGVWGLKRKP